MWVKVPRPAVKSQFLKMVHVLVKDVYFVVVGCSVPFMFIKSCYSALLHIY